MICYLPSNQLRKSFKIDKYKGSVGNVSLVYIYKANGWCTTGENIEESSEQWHDGNDDVSRGIRIIIGWDFPGGLVVENPPAYAGNTGPGRFHVPWGN